MRKSNLILLRIYMLGLLLEAVGNVDNDLVYHPGLFTKS